MMNEEQEQASVQLGEEMRDTVSDIANKVFTCTGDHALRSVKYVDTLEVSICLDRQCAHIIAKCTHQTEIPESEDTVPRKYTKTACEWNEDGTVLTCTFCGVDGT
jgi:hypothetical protein